MRDNKGGGVMILCGGLSSFVGVVGWGDSASLYVIGGLESVPVDDILLWNTFVGKIMGVQ